MRTPERQKGWRTTPQTRTVAARPVGARPQNEHYPKSLVASAQSLPEQQGSTCIALLLLRPIKGAASMLQKRQAVEPAARAQ